jgi:hypothetical protein
MHPVRLDDGEITILKQALREGDWKQLPTWKLRYVYQRFTKSHKDIKDIGKLAKSKQDMGDEELAKEAEKIFGIE